MFLPVRIAPIDAKKNVAAVQTEFLKPKCSPFSLARTTESEEPRIARGGEESVNLIEKATALYELI
jgi:hypothetical protein